jgi:hypothetical protein
MKPLGRKYFKNSGGSKHHVRAGGKYFAWWLNICTPNKKADRQKAKKDIKEESEDNY